MVVRHNLTAMNANRMLGMTQSSQAKSSEKLSSGYRINRAADDAAGLSISEKMRKQIKGLDKASSNAQDGVSAVQTAEGALTEVHSMLQRMNELAVQASNGTNSEDDRAAIQAEIEQLTTEIDRVAETTKFNETYLLKGSADGVTTTKTVTAHDAGLIGKLTENTNGTSTFALDKKLENGDKITIAGKEYTIGKKKTDDDYIEDSVANALTLKEGDSVTAGGEKVTVVNKVTEATADAYTWAVGDKFIDADGIEWNVIADDADASSDNTLSDNTTDIKDAKVDGKGNVEIADVAGKLNSGSIILVNANKTITSDNKMEVVGSLATGEYSALATDLTADGVAGKTLVAGDVVEKKDGTTKTVTTETPDSFTDISKEIMKLEADATTAKTVSITRDGSTKTYSVSSKTDLSDSTNLKATREDIINMIQEGDAVNVNGTGAKTVYGVNDSATEGTITATEAYRLMAEELTKASSIGADTTASVVNNNDGTFEIKQGTVETKEALNFNLHVGADADMTNKISVYIESMGSANLGIKGITVADDTGVNATYAIDAITDALSKVSSQRSALGAIQNRLEHTIDNLDNVVENTTAAESRIRDTDMAKEMVEFSKTNILAQAGQSILAQANQSTQGILSLLG